MATKHDSTANRIAKQHGTDYNKGQGPDIQTPGKVIEVESEGPIPDAGRQLAGFKRPVHVAGATKEATEKALERYKDATIGVMNSQGKIVKPSTRKKGK